MSNYLVFCLTGLLLLGVTGSAGAQCPEDWHDPGECDTLYVECYDSSFMEGPPPWQVRFPLLVTNDIPDPVRDSISAMLIELCFTSSNPDANALIEAVHNNVNLYPFPDLSNSIFRHLPGMDDPQIHNWMMDLSEQEMGLEWDTRVLDLGGGTHFWFRPVRTGPQDQGFCGGSRILLASITFTLDDTTTICIDTCHSPIPEGPLDFATAWVEVYTPRHNMPYCATVVGQCPDQHPNDPGDCDSFHVDVYPADQYQLSFPAHVRFPMRVTNDIPDPYIDSIAGIVVPFCFASSNPAANAVIDPNHNNTNVYPLSDLNQSIFRHLPSMEYPTERNLMMDLSEPGLGLEWDTRILDLGGGAHFWMSLVPTGTPDQRFPGGSRVLTVTATFTVEDTTTVCIDTCFWPPGGWSVIRFTRSDAVTYSPQFTMPYCASVELSERGDATGDGVVNIADVMYMINYLYRSGPPPVSFEAGDANCDDDHSLLDIVFLINYLYKGGPPPGC
ncbi:MAG: hypothetical protein JSV10_00800 [Candidatus Zixiibacteriota bacterium]|nr:MAG: hypothetical protein JSV10_00800 [candidate division Zixibacteria bacterium]